MDNSSILKKVEQQYENNLPFVLYSYPKKESVNFILQKDNLAYDTESSFKEYFIFSPFDSISKNICIPLEKSYQFETVYKKNNFKVNEVKASEHANDKNSYLKLVDDTIREIKSNKATKIVVSRKKIVKLKNIDLLKLIERVLNLYPKALDIFYEEYRKEHGL